MGVATALVACKREPLPAGSAAPIAEARDGIVLSYPDLAFAPDGTLWVSWVEIDSAQETADIWVVRSDDGGVTFSIPSQVNDTNKLFLGGVRQPVLVADDARVAIAVGGGSYIDSTIRLYIADTDSAAQGWQSLVLDEAHYRDGGPSQPSALTLVDQPEVALDPDGQLMLNWKQGTFEESFQLVLARERDGFAISRLEDGVSGQPCECCPTDWLVLPDGETLLAFRNNERDLREIFLARSPDGTQYGEGTAQVSDTAWEIGGCPLDGPVLARAGDALVATWADASRGDSYQWWAVSRDEGRHFGPSQLVYPDNVESLTWPSIAVAPDGEIWTSTVEILHGTLLSSSTDLGETFSIHSADSPDGPLFFSELAAGPDGVGLIGVTESGALWFLAPRR